jgi:two-component system, NtrC family, response regulator AtoC
LALLDLKMPVQDGMAVLRAHADRLDETPIIVVTAYGGGSAAIAAMKLGAFDYITKPFDLDDVLFAVKRALTQRALAAQVRALSDDRNGETDDEELVGRGPAMLQVFKTIGRVAATQEPVLILGESGVGKELAANAIHRNSDRAHREFVKVNCAALSPTLLESELFGHERGAFTGAVARRIGRFEQAEGGTLFLDEIGELVVELQAKLLRVVQTGRFERVGGEEAVQTDVRVIAATNRDLPSRIAEGRFREDLYYRLNVVSLEIPPLRQRREDIPLLAEQIVRRLALKYGWPHLALAAEAAPYLAGRPWPGNVRELQGQRFAGCDKRLAGTARHPGRNGVSRDPAGVGTRKVEPNAGGPSVGN